MKKFVVLSSVNRGCISNYMLNDLQELENVQFYYVKKIGKMHNKISNIIIECFSRIKWSIRGKKEFYNLIKEKSVNEICLIITNEVVSRLSLKFLKKLKLLGIEIVLILIDPLSQQYKSVVKTKDIINKFEFTKILSFDPKDSMKYGFDYCYTLYSKVKLSKEKNYVDLFYAGNIKNRIEFFEKLNLELEKYNITAKINLLGCNRSQRSKVPKKWILKRYQPYECMLEEMNSAKCILDITQEGQTGVTLRYYEAVVYNKKLLTNNNNIKKMPFYNEQYMKIYNDYNEIDWQWVTDDEMPNYNYCNQFSAVKIIDKLG